MNTFALNLLFAIGGFVLGFAIAVKSFDGLISSRCDEIGVVNLGDGYYDCEKRP